MKIRTENLRVNFSTAAAKSKKKKEEPKNLITLTNYNKIELESKLNSINKTQIQLTQNNLFHPATNLPKLTKLGNCN